MQRRREVREEVERGVPDQEEGGRSWGGRQVSDPAVMPGPTPGEPGTTFGCSGVL